MQPPGKAVIHVGPELAPLHTKQLMLPLPPAQGLLLSVAAGAAASAPADAALKGGEGTAAARELRASIVELLYKRACERAHA